MILTGSRRSPRLCTQTARTALRKCWRCSVRYYFEQYEAYTGAPHPPIRAIQIDRIICEMPYIDETDKANSTMDIDPDCYEDMIDRHFRTRYRNCDYNINHFFSGRIRELRFYETCY